MSVVLVFVPFLVILRKDKLEWVRDQRGRAWAGTWIQPSESQTRKTIGIIYDASFLMSNKIIPDILNTKIGLDGGFDGELAMQIYREHFYVRHHFLVANVIPQEVLQEIQTHFINPEKSKSAKQAKERVIEMVKEGVDEVDLSGVSVSHESNSIIGADSVTDRKLIAYALFKIENGWDYALIATNDDGIVYDVLKLNQQGRKITTYPFNEFEESEFFLQLTDLMGVDWRSAGRWVRDISAWKTGYDGKGVTQEKGS